MPAAQPRARSRTAARRPRENRISFMWTLSAGATGSLRQVELDDEGVVDFDGLPVQERGRVPPALERGDDRAVHEGKALHDAAAADLPLHGDDALHDHRALDLFLEGLRRVLGIRAGELVGLRHGVVELDGLAEHAADLAAHHSADHATDHAALHSALDALVLLGLLHLGRLLLDLGDLLRLDDLLLLRDLGGLHLPRRLLVPRGRRGWRRRRPRRAGPAPHPRLPPLWPAPPYIWKSAN